MFLGDNPAPSRDDMPSSLRRACFIEIRQQQMSGGLLTTSDYGPLASDNYTLQSFNSLTSQFFYSGKDHNDLKFSRGILDLDIINFIDRTS